MTMLVFKFIRWIWIITLIGSVTSQYRSNYNPTIIQDSRLEPKVDGTFGFQYKTEDGITHAAKGDPTGFIQGSYSYKDPTGLKVNFNYFAGSRGNNQNPTPQPQYTPTSYDNQEPQYNNQPYYSEQDYYETYRPRTRPPASYTRPQNQQTFDRRYTDTRSLQVNDVYDDVDYQRSG